MQTPSPEKPRPAQQQQILQIQEQLEQVQLNGIKTQASMESQLKAAMGQLQAAREEIEDIKARLDSSDGAASPYLKTTTALKSVGAASLAWYVLRSMSAPPVSKLSYSKAMRHIHLLMGVGIAGGIGSVQVAQRLEPGPEKKLWMEFHKSSGVLMLAGIFLRIVLRLRSPIPERFPGPKPLQLLESLSHRAFYVLMLLLPASGIAYNYCSGLEIPILGWKKTQLEEEDGEKAQKAMTWHRQLGQITEYGWVPFHLLTLAYHSARGRNVVKRIAPF